MLNTGILSHQKFQAVLVSLCTAFTLVFAQLANADINLKENYPERHTVVEGDTLWDISARFLEDPWRWPEIWQGNPEVNNPDLIYPGDVLVLTFIDGKPYLKALRSNVVKLSPTAKSTSFRDAIPPIEPSAIQAYLNAPLVTDDDELDTAGYVVEGVGNRLLMGKYDQFYARKVEGDSTDEFRVFRPGRKFVDPVSKELLGYEAKHIADAQILRSGDPARLSVLNTYSEDISIADRLRPVTLTNSLPYFYPQAPSNLQIRGQILPVEGMETAELGPLSIVAINLGSREEVVPGTVFRIKSQHKHKVDPVTKEDYSIPEENSGLMLVFRTFEKVSYAIITNASKPIEAYDVLVSPDLDRK
jgi:hypothetical protein